MTDFRETRASSTTPRQIFTKIRRNGFAADTLATDGRTQFQHEAFLVYFVKTAYHYHYVRKESGCHTG